MNNRKFWADFVTNVFVCIAARHIFDLLFNQMDQTTYWYWIAEFFFVVIITSLLGIWRMYAYDKDYESK